MIKDFSKYKRLFTFGCSCTKYKWPTWADVIKEEIDDVEFYNFGETGLGNLYISSRVAEANKRFKFNDTDLVMIMWTSFTREDRWFDGKWHGQGNIYNQNLYPESWVRQFADPDGYLIKNYSLIELTSTYLKSLPSDTIMLSAWPFSLLENSATNNKMFSTDILNQCRDLYSDTVKDIPISLRNWLENKLKENTSRFHSAFHLYGHTYLRGKEMFQDGHTNPKWYYHYLVDLGFPLTDKSRNFAYKSLELLEKCKADEEIVEMFKEYSTYKKYGMF